MASYDINENGLLNFNNVFIKIKLFQKPMEKAEIYIFPANSKVVKKFDDKLTVFRVLKWIEKNAENKLLLPEIPHIDLELQDEYYKKKSVLESYEENTNKDDFEIDDLINMDFQKIETSETTGEREKQLEL